MIVPGEMFLIVVAVETFSNEHTLKMHIDSAH